MIRKLSYLIFISLLIFKLVVALSYSYFVHPYFGFSQSGKLVYIEPGSSLEKIGQLLYAKRIIPNQRLFKWYIRFLGKADKIKAGEYYFQQGSSLASIYDKLINGKVYLHRLTIPEGADLLDIADLFQKHGICSRDEFLRLAFDSSYIADITPKGESLEGFLFPDTYYFTKGVEPIEIIKMMYSRFNEAFNALSNQSDMQQQFELVTMASLIEKETSIPEEKPIIASVFYNRLKKNIPLQCDPTIIYALKRENRFDGNLKRVHLKLNTPYNTYIHPGLPPGPICNPGIESYRSSLYPAETDYLYFVSKNDGSHYFSRSLKEHNRAVSKYQKAYWRLKWKKQRELNQRVRNDIN